jgi:cytochrome c5
VIFKFQFDPPKTAEDWATLQNNALNLAEAGNLLLLPGRAKDNGEWTKHATALVETGSQAFKAANAKDAKALEEIGNKIDDTCEACHAKYLPKPSQ